MTTPRQHRWLGWFFAGLMVFGTVTGSSPAIPGAMFVAAIVSFAAADILEALGK